MYNLCQNEFHVLLFKRHTSFHAKNMRLISYANNKDKYPSELLFSLIGTFHCSLR